MSKREIKLYLNDISTSAEKIEKYVEDVSFDDFLKDSKLIDAVIRNLTIIGEAANNIPEEIKLKYPEVPWIEIIGMRNKVIHEYFGVDEEILWKTIKEDLPFLKNIIAKLKF